jgi:hypothetical protein
VRRTTPVKGVGVSGSTWFARGGASRKSWTLCLLVDRVFASNPGDALERNRSGQFVNWIGRGPLETLQNIREWVFKEQFRNVAEN